MKRCRRGCGSILPRIAQVSNGEMKIYATLTLTLMGKATARRNTQDPRQMPVSSATELFPSLFTVNAFGGVSRVYAGESPLAAKMRARDRDSQLRDTPPLPKSGSPSPLPSSKTENGRCCGDCARGLLRNPVFRTMNVACNRCMLMEDLTEGIDRN